MVSLLLVLIQKCPWLLLIPTHAYAKQTALDTGLLVLRKTSYLVYATLRQIVAAMMSRQQQLNSTRPLLQSLPTDDGFESEWELPENEVIYPHSSSEYVLFSISETDEDFDLVATTVREK